VSHCDCELDSARGTPFFIGAECERIEQQSADEARNAANNGCS
jgi:hypothetical protein